MSLLGFVFAMNFLVATFFGRTRVSLENESRRREWGRCLQGCRDDQRQLTWRATASVHKTWRERTEFRLDQLFHGRASALRALGISLSMSSDVTSCTPWYSLFYPVPDLRALLPRCVPCMSHCAPADHADALRTHFRVPATFARCERCTLVWPSRCESYHCDRECALPCCGWKVEGASGSVASRGAVKHGEGCYDCSKWLKRRVRRCNWL